VRARGLLGEAGQSDHFLALAFSPHGELTWNCCPRFRAGPSLAKNRRTQR
jgi:hypothetical protein